MEWQLSRDHDQRKALAKLPGLFKIRKEVTTEETEVLKEFEPHINQFGAVVPQARVSQNDPLFTAFYVFCLEDVHGKVPLQEMDRLIVSFDAYLRADGATLRSPESQELDSHDNLIAWSALSQALDPEWAERILKFARANGWQWPGDAHPFRSWLGRHRAVEASLMLAAKETPDFLIQFFWIIGVLSGAFGNNKNAGGFEGRWDNDAFNHSYTMVRVLLKEFKVSSNKRRMQILPMLATSLAHTIIWKMRGITIKENLTRYGLKDLPWPKWIKELF